MALAPPYPPNSGLVAQAWVAQRVPGITADIVSSELPRDLTAWQEQGFVQVTIVPGSPDIDDGTRHPVVQIDCWANAGTTGRPPKGKAWRLAETVLGATESDVQVFGKGVTLPAGYNPARVLSVHPATEPQEMPDPESNYARVNFDLRLDWVAL